MSRAVEWMGGGGLTAPLSRDRIIVCLSDSNVEL